MPAYLGDGAEGRRVCAACARLDGGTGMKTASHKPQDGCQSRAANSQLSGKLSLSRSEAGLKEATFVSHIVLIHLSSSPPCS